MIKRSRIASSCLTFVTVTDLSIMRLIRVNCCVCPRIGCVIAGSVRAGLSRSRMIPRPFIDLIFGRMQQCCHLGTAIPEISTGTKEEMIWPYQSFRDTPQLFKIVSFSVTDVTCKRGSRISYPKPGRAGQVDRLPELWYIGSAIGPPLSKS